ncbi:large ribosomal subunit protein bL9m-like isoform X1 [Convolutriloba macropyga]|uniref:large ribosomal subunit protein bL9m-like isoform X1 n=1 Tax=Convolutriloba macropyga TaxID=536237 RepID=UPI003F528984
MTVALNSCSLICLHQIWRRQMSWLLKRRYPPPVPVSGKAVVLDPEHFVYDVVKCTHDRKRPDIETIFIKDMPGYAYAGEMRFVDRDEFRKKLLPHKLAVYASEFNRKWYEVDTNYVNGIFLKNGATSTILDIMNFLKQTLVINVEYLPEIEERVLINSQFISLMLKLKYKLIVNSNAIKINNEFGGFAQPGEYVVDVLLNGSHSVPLNIKIVDKIVN